jgi:hypothetical protein
MAVNAKCMAICDTGHAESINDFKIKFFLFVL